MRPSFGVVWQRIVACQGKTFETKTGLPFTYKVSGESLKSSRANQLLPKSDLERAYTMVPFEGPGDISKELRGPAYIWAVLHDRRIRQNQW
jgi:hypothetical protein